MLLVTDGGLYILIAPTAVNLALTMIIACWNLSSRLVKGDNPNIYGSG
jgi:hypothetical protein